MRHELGANQFRHIIFPREEVRRRPVDFAPGIGSFTTSEPAHVDLPEDDSRFLTWLFTRAGLDSRQYRTEALHRRLNACLRTLRASNPAHARQLIEHNPLLLNPALSSMLVGVTSFFRDPAVFEQLATEVLPELNEQRKVIYAWSGGCSDGPELYSLAMLFAEAGLMPKAFLLGTDCREEAIQTAREGRYGESALCQLSAERKSRFMEQDEADWRIVSSLRSSVRWRIGSLLGDLEAGLWDLILFRNTAMYLRMESARNLWQKAEAALRPGGFLVLGRAERPYGAHRLRAIGPCIFRRQRS